MHGRFQRRNVQELTLAVPVALAGALVLIAVYHAAVVGPRLRRLTRSSATHDELLGGGAASPATRRLETLETANAATQTELTSIGGRLEALERVARSGPSEPGTDFTSRDLAQLAQGLRFRERLGQARPLSQPVLIEPSHQERGRAVIHLPEAD